MAAIPLKQYSKSELRCIVKDPSIDPAHPPIGFTPMNQKKFDSLVKQIYSDKDYREELAKCKFSLQDYKPAKLIPIKLVKIILTHTGINYKE